MFVTGGTMLRGHTETEFEKRRGVSSVEVRHGFAQVHVSRIADGVMAQRLRVLKSVAEAGISLDFLKLTPSGMSFLVPEQDADTVEATMGDFDHHFSVRHGRSIVLVYAVSIRDEEGLIAGIVHRAIAHGVRIDHIGDMHDRMLMVVEQTDADRLGDLFRTTLLETDSRASINEVADGN